MHLMHLDREPDGSERKVVTAYARAWGIPDSQLALWDKQYDRHYSNVMSRLWRSLTGLVRVR